MTALPDGRFQRNINMDCGGRSAHSSFTIANMGLTLGTCILRHSQMGLRRLVSPVRLTRCIGCLTWITLMWEMLGTVASAEFGAVYTDELGTLNFRTHEEIRPADGLSEVVETYTVERHSQYDDQPVA